MPVCRMYVLLYIVSGFIGLVVIMSLVLATFQQDYENQISAASSHQTRTRTRSLTVSYCLGTFDSATSEFGSNIKYDSFVDMMNYFEYSKDENSRKPQTGASVFPASAPSFSIPRLGPGNLTTMIGKPYATTGACATDCGTASSPDTGSLKSYCVEQSVTDDVVENADRTKWSFLFNLLNVDDDDGVDLEEFEYVFHLHELISYVNESPQLSYMVRLGRVEAELGKRQTVHKRAQEHTDLSMLEDLKLHLQRKLADAQRAGEQGVRPGLISLRAWDRLALVLVQVHMFGIVMAFSSKITSLDTEPFHNLIAFFPFYYCFEISNRIFQQGGMKKFWKNPEQPRLQFQHRIDCYVSFTSLLCTIVMMIVAGIGHEHPRMLELMSNIGVVRLLVIHKPFRHLLYSCVTGLEPLRMYLVLMLIVYYYFSLVATHCFRDMALEDYSFDGLGASLLTMHQVYFGEAWNLMMMDVHATNLDPAIYVFFIVFYLTMGILFVQLFSGIIINLFLRSEEWRQKGGSIYVLLGSINPYLASKTQDELEQLVHDLSELHV